MRLLGPDGVVLFEKADDGTGGRPEVQRRLLLDSPPEGTVRRDRKVTGTRALGEGRYEVTYADGAWSRVRPLLTGRRARRSTRTGKAAAPCTPT
jgi:hypothetical protein